MDFNLKTLQGELGIVLQENILDYWEKYSVDDLSGGFIGQVNADNTKSFEANKGLILNARILWTFSISAVEMRSDDYQKLADRAYTYIQKYFRDPIYGGVYWELDYLGIPTQRKKQIYGQAFTIYALSEYYCLTGIQEVLDWAIEIYKLMEQHSYDDKYVGYIEAFGEDWSSLSDVRLSEKDANYEKTMNTHLHVLEAYTCLLQIWPNDQLKLKLTALINVFLERFIKSDGHLSLFFTRDWVLSGNTISYGHDIECAWLLTEAVQEIDDEDLIEKVRLVAVKIANGFIEEGIDYDGGVINEREGSNGKFDYDKHWWPQAEALVGLMNAYTITKDPKYVDALLKVWSFARKYHIDHENGEWHWLVNREGKPDLSKEKVGFWKCPYHNARACFEMINRIKHVKK
ncbi:AGE family epimerase/isomerase [Labilibaculum antarcticum]|nr:AGE family epimerase/isomerase [Labilibaculum antarcticum]